VSQGSEDLSFTRQQQQLGVLGQKLGSRLEVCTTMGWWKSDRFNQKSHRFHKKKSVEMGTDAVGMPKDGITQEQWESCWDAVCYAFGKLSTKSMCKC